MLVQKDKIEKPPKIAWVTTVEKLLGLYSCFKDAKVFNPCMSIAVSDNPSKGVLSTE